MARMRLQVPGELVELFYDQLECSWEIKAEAAMELETAAGPAPPDARRARGERYAIEALLDQVVWEELSGEQSVELVGDHATFDDLLVGMTFQLAGSIGDASDAAYASGDGYDGVATHLDQFKALVGLLQQTRRVEARRPSDRRVLHAEAAA